MINQSQLTGDVIVAAQGIYSDSSTQLHPLGAYVSTNDGRAFRYVKAGVTALVAGKLQQASAEDTTNFQNLTVAVNSVGDVSVVTTTTVTLTVNQLAGGFLTVTSATTGAGFTYRIRGNTAATSAVTTITLDDPIVVATTGTVKVDCILNPYQNLIVNPATASSAPVGVAVYNITAAYFGWVQTRGVVSCLADGTVTVGTALDASNGTAGAVEAHAEAGVQATVGLAITGIATTEYGLIFVTLD